jgi:hypothetical protein
MTSDPSNPIAPGQPRGVSRRTVLVLCVASAAAGGVGTAALSRLFERPARTHSWNDIASALLPMDAAGWPALGEICEAALAERNRPLGSSPALAGFQYSDAGVVTPDGLPAVHAAFEDRVAQEFGDGRTVIVDRWVLSETQAALCALAARSGAGES